MKGEKKGGHLEEIKKIEKNREERRVKMEEAKREKEKRKVENEKRGKDVDIDFELMIEKSKFKEKMLSPHTSSDQLKVPAVPSSSPSVSANGPSSKRKSRAEK